MVTVDHKTKTISLMAKDIIKKDLSDDYEVTEQFYDNLVWMIEWLSDYRKFEKTFGRKRMESYLQSFIAEGIAIHKK